MRSIQSDEKERVTVFVRSHIVTYSITSYI